ncbi:unnamed protein product [Parnassius apollo]|uniref:(apollo) hypothetical protein n=1 Tax=Parnassius apollo TaxID=110799 RepID=A0A8S3YE58_PARAO|nr:unnamed protein product [Parnassius apollo]
MTQRLLDITKWLWWVLIIHSAYNPVRCVSVSVKSRINPATVGEQAKFFQYRHLPSHEDYDQGHRLGSARHFTERHERSRPSTGLFSAKVRWGDKKGGYGEHYWDLNHAGHTGNHGDDGYDNSGDGAYHEEEDNDSYDEPSDHSPNYQTNNYNPEAAMYEENGRTKRAHTRPKAQRKEIEEQTRRPQKQTKKSEHLQLPDSDSADKHETEDRDHKQAYEKYSNQNVPLPSKQEQYSQKEFDQPREKNQMVLVVGHKERETQDKDSHLASRQLETSHYVPYEDGSGIRQHYHPELAAANTAPRLFLETSTGHVVDRTTGQAYVLQPILRNHNYS